MRQLVEGTDKIVLKSKEMNPMTKNILLAVIVAIIAGGTTYYVTNQQAQIDKADLDSKVSELEAQIQKLKQQNGNNGSSNGESDKDEYVFKFTELGIQMTIPESIKDLTYSVTSGKLTSGQDSVTAYVSTSSITKLDKNCSQSLGALSKVSGQYPPSPNPENSAGTLVKQFSSFYIGYTHPQSTCSFDTSVEQKASDSLTAFRNAFSTITLIK